MGKCDGLGLRLMYSSEFVCCYVVCSDLMKVSGEDMVGICGKLLVDCVFYLCCWCFLCVVVLLCVLVCLMVNVKCCVSCLLGVSSVILCVVVLFGRFIVLIG